jgi:C4-dicarboxylate transporter DctM subunit
MSAPIIGILGVAVLLVLLFARMWVGLAMGVVGFLGFGYLGGFSGAFSLLVSEPFAQLSSYTLSVVVMFTLMGVVTANTRISEDLFHCANTWVGQFRGGLALATTSANAMFGAMCGSSMVAAITFGKVAVPQMLRFNYDRSLALGSVAAGGSLSALIPPSLGFVFIAILTEQSVGQLLMAGIGPGVLMLAAFILCIIILTRLKPELAPPAPKTTFREKVASLKFTWAMLLIFLLIVGGIYRGIFTPTEAGAVGAFGALVVGAIGRRITIKSLTAAFVEAVITTGMIAGILIGAFIFMRFITISQLPTMLANYINGLGINAYLVLILVVVMYVILGMFTDILAAVILTIPIIFPTMEALGFSPIWLGVVVVILIEMGMITPPLGMNVFILAGSTKTPMGVIFRGVWPFVVAELACIIIITAVPQIVLFIPNSM